MTAFEIKDITIDYTIYPRVQNVWMKAYEYKLAMEAGSEFPPIKLGLYRKKHYLIDGLHRLKAYESMSIKTVDVTIKEYTSKKDMFIDALLSNNVHGKPLTVMDKASNFAKLQDFGVSKKDISRLLGVPQREFATLIAYLVTKKGERIPIKSILKKAIQNQVITEEDVAEMISKEKQKNYVSRSIMNAFEQLIDAITQGAVPWDNPAINAMATQLLVLLNEALKMDSDKNGQ